MAGEIIRPSALPDRPSPVASEKVPVDNGITVGGSTIEALVNAGRPLASQAEAEAGVQPSKAMAPLTTKQAIFAIVPPMIAAAVGNLPAIGIESRTWAVANYHPAIAPGSIRTEGYFGAGDIGGALYRSVDSEPLHAGKFSITLADGATETWYEIAEPVLRPQMFGEVGTLNDYATFQKWAETTVALKAPWEVTTRDYVIDGAAPLVLKTSGVCCGRLLVPKNNNLFKVDFKRDDEAGTVLDTSAWGSLTRNATAVGATNAVGKNLRFVSSEILIERGQNSSDYTPYYKQEMARCRQANGELTTGLVCTYVSKANLVVTAYTPDRPIVVQGLTIVRTGALAPLDTGASARNYRDNVTFNDLSISTENLTLAMGQGFTNIDCCDVTFNRPHIRGCNYDGTGYGIQNAKTIGVTVNQPNIYDCREALAGRHNIDLVVNGGTVAPIIDDHWGDRMVINDTVIKSAPGSTGVLYAGNDITLNNVTQFNGRTMLAIRLDTPNLGGSVIINNPHVVSLNEDPAHGFYLFSLSSPNGLTYTGTRTVTPRLPDHVEINSGSVQSNTNVGIRYLAYLGTLYGLGHVNWGQVTISGTWRLSGAFTGIYFIKNQADQQSRDPVLTIDGTIDFQGGIAIYANTADVGTSRTAKLKINGAQNFSVSVHPLSFSHLEIENARLTSITSLNLAASYAGSTHIRSSRWDGGAVSASYRNIAIVGCAFMGAYSEFPAISYPTMIGNYKNAGATGLPADIRTNVVSPFS